MGHADALENQVKTNNTAADGGHSQYKTAKLLSGGERSYSTVSLLLALWETSSGPLRCLDEWDVFLDPVNRSVAAEMLVSGALELEYPWHKSARTNIHSYKVRNNRSESSSCLSRPKRWGISRSIGRSTDRSRWRIRTEISKIPLAHCLSSKTANESGDRCLTFQHDICRPRSAYRREWNVEHCFRSASPTCKPDQSTTCLLAASVLSVGATSGVTSLIAKRS